MLEINAASGQEGQSLGLVGRTGENASRRIVFDCEAVLGEFPGAGIVCALRRACDAEAYAKELGGVQVTIRAKAGANGKLFGAVTSQEISDALKAQFGVDIEKNKIVQNDPIKSYGSYTVKAKLGYEISGTINVLVVEG